MTPDLMNIVGGGNKGEQAPNAISSQSQGNTPPVTAPMSTPQPAEGTEQSAMININMAMDLLEASLASFGSESEEGQTLLNTLSSLSRKFGASKKKAEGLVPAEIMQLMQTLPQAGGGSPESRAMNAPATPPSPQPPQPM
jgi:hypothetical protein